MNTKDERKRKRNKRIDDSTTFMLIAEVIWEILIFIPRLILRIFD